MRPLSVSEEPCDQRQAAGGFNLPRPLDVPLVQSSHRGMNGSFASRSMLQQQQNPAKAEGGVRPDHQRRCRTGSSCTAVVFRKLFVAWFVVQVLGPLRRTLAVWIGLKASTGAVRSVQ